MSARATSLRALAGALCLALAGCMGAEVGSPTAPPWRLAPAPSVADGTHLIVTVPTEDPEALAETGAALERAHAVSLVAEWPLGSIDVHCYVFRVAPTTEVDRVLAGLAADPRVRTAQRMQQFETLALTPEDDLSAMQGSLRALRVPALHAHADGSGVRVAVVDTRADARHPDLAGRLVEDRDFVQDGRAGGERHGTAVAGVIGARGADGRGITGIAPGAAVLGLRACWEGAGGGRGTCSSFTLARALNFALLNDVQVMNLSLGGPRDPLLAELIDRALALGVLVVAAQGRAGDFPASQPGVLAVDLADGGTGERAVFAPGTDVLTTVPQDGYDFLSGASMAAASVSGLSALLIELLPGFAPAALAGAIPPGPIDTCGLLYRLDPDLAPTVCADAAVGGVGERSARS